MSQRKLRIKEMPHGREGVADYRTREEGERRTRPVEARAFTDAPRDLSMRSISAAIYVVAIVVCLLGGRIPTALLVSAMSFMCYYELHELVQAYDCDPSLFIGGLGSITFPLVALLPSGTMMPTVFLFVLAVAAWYMTQNQVNFVDMAVTIFGATYTGFLFSSLVVIRDSAPGMPGALLAFGVLGSVWLMDVAAYYLGTMFGEHKMAPNISPNKSWEGFASGLVACVLTWIVISVTKIADITLVQALITGLAVGLSGVLGDLVESKTKRGVGAKDSGNLMPGHGGMLDRSDSILFACAAARALLHIWGIL